MPALWEQLPSWQHRVEPKAYLMKRVCDQACQRDTVSLSGIKKILHPCCKFTSILLQIQPYPNSNLKDQLQKREKIWPSLLLSFSRFRSRGSVWVDMLWQNQSVASQHCKDNRGTESIRNNFTWKVIENTKTNLE